MAFIRKSTFDDLLEAIKASQRCKKCGSVIKIERRGDFHYMVCVRKTCKYEKVIRPIEYAHLKTAA